MTSNQLVDGKHSLHFSSPCSVWLRDIYRGRKLNGAEASAVRRLRLGMGGFSQVPKPESFINSKALIDAGRDTHIPSRDVYANNPNSYINHIRDNGFVERYDVARREPSHYRYAQPLAQSSPGVTPTAMNVAQPMPSLPLASFYDANGSDRVAGRFARRGRSQGKRTVFDQASQLALAETKKSGVASIATVTDARQKLLEYGRPSLAVCADP